MIGGLKLPDIQNKGSNIDRYGRYFGICTSYHHSKACRCKKCPSYPGDELFMFCSKGKSRSPKEKSGCLCVGCPIHEKFALKGDYFCHKGGRE